MWEGAGQSRAERGRKVSSHTSRVLLFSLRETGRSQQGSEPSEQKRLERAGEESGRRTQVRFLGCLRQDAIGSDGEK